MAGENVRLGLLVTTDGSTGRSIADLLAIRAAIKKTAEEAPGITRLAQALGSSYKEAKKFSDGLGLSADKAEAAVAALRQLNAVGADTATKFQVLANNLDITAEQFDALDKAARKTGQSSASLGSILQGIGQGIGQAGFGVVASTLSTIPSLVAQNTLQFEKFKTVLKTLYGDAGKADQAFAQIQQFAATTPFQLDEVLGSFIKLKNRGIDPTTENLTRLGDIASSQGKSLDQITEAVLDAMSGENERLKEFGIAAKTVGDNVTFTFKGVQQTVERTPEAITGAILKFGELQGVAGGMEAQSKTLGGQLSNLQDNISKIAVAFGEELIPVLAKFVEGINAGGGSAEQFARELGQNTAQLLQLLVNALKFAADNAKLLEVVLVTLALRFAALKVAAVASSLQQAGAAMIAAGAAGGTGAVGVTAFASALQGMIASAVAAIAPLAALAAVVGFTLFVKQIKDLENFNQSLESVSQGAQVAGDAAISLANKTKALNDAIKASGTATAEQKRNAQQLIGINRQQIASLQDQLNQAKALKPASEEQAEAQKSLIANLEASIGALQSQTDALEKNAAAGKTSTDAASARAEAAKKEAEAIKAARETEKQQAEQTFQDTELAIQRQLQDEKEEREKALQEELSQIQERADQEATAAKKQGEAEIAAFQKEQETLLEQQKQDFEKNVIAPLQQENERILQETKRTFDKEQAAFKLQEERKLQEEERKFNQSQQEAERKFKRQQDQERKQAEKGFDTQQTAIDRQLELETAKNDGERARLQQQFAQEDALAKRRAELEAPLRAAREAFEEAQRQKEVAFQAQQDQAKLEFEQNVLTPLKQELEGQLEQRRLEFEQNTFNPLKQQLEEQLVQRRKDFEENVIAPLKQQIEDELDKRREALEQKVSGIRKAAEAEIAAAREIAAKRERDVDRQAEDAKRERERAFKALQRALDDQAQQRQQQALKKATADSVKSAYQDPAVKQAISDAVAEGFQKNASGTPNATPKPKARRWGGPVAPGEPYLVGEVGPELIIPTTPGYVLTAQQTAALLANRPSVLPVFPSAGTAASQPLLNELKASREEIVRLRQQVEQMRPINQSYEINTVNPMDEVYRATRTAARIRAGG